MPIFLDPEQKIIRTIKATMPAVVSVVISRSLSDLEHELPPDVYQFLPNGNGRGKKKRKIDIPEELIDSHGMVQIGGGSGFIVQSNGVILTNKHVISDPEAEYTVILNDGRKFPARVESRDPINDVAVLKINVDKLPTSPMGDATRLELGQSVIAIGNALGVFRNTVSVGIVSGLSRSITAQPDPRIRPQEMRGLIQTDAAINPGNSGGPLVDLSGRVVGINAAIVSGAQSISFAIPINAAHRDLDDLKKYGHIRRPYLGIRYIILDDEMGAKMKLPVGYGAYITRESPHDKGVILDGPADKAGLAEGDVLLELNEEKVTQERTVQDILDELDVGDEVGLLVLRDNREIRTKTTLTERK